MNQRETAAESSTADFVADKESDDDERDAKNSSNSTAKSASASTNTAESGKRPRAKQQISRRLSSQVHVASVHRGSIYSGVSAPQVLDDGKRLALAKLISKFPEPPSEIRIEPPPAPIMSSISLSAMKAVSSGWGAVRGLWGGGSGGGNNAAAVETK